MLVGGGGGEPVQQMEQMVEDGHVDHDSHFSWTHGYMFVPYSAVAVALIGAGVKVYLARRRKHNDRPDTDR